MLKHGFGRFGPTLGTNYTPGRLKLRESCFSTVPKRLPFTSRREYAVSAGVKIRLL